MSKKNRRVSKKWGKPQAVLPEGTSFGLDLYTYAGKICLWILHLNKDNYLCWEAHERKDVTITDLLDLWT